MRIDSAAKYLAAIQESLQIGWLTVFSKPQKNIFERLALLNPAHFEALELPLHRTVESLQHSMQGKRKFDSKLGANSCQSVLIWGYPCQLNGDIQQDHLFPYSLGGPTLPMNRIYLCKYHNMVKSSDIHCYPWESTQQWAEPWLEIQLEKLYKQVFNQYK